MDRQISEERGIWVLRNGLDPRQREAASARDEHGAPMFVMYIAADRDEAARLSRNPRALYVEQDVYAHAGTTQ